MRIAIDTGGTFTDCVFVRGARLEVLKVPSTPRHPAEAIGAALARILAARPAGPGRRGEKPSLELVCGTTVGTNALLERRGSRVAFVTTAGFEDLLEIGRQARPRLYDFFVDRPEPLVPRALRFGLAERVAADGQVLRRPSRAEWSRLCRQVARSRAETVAVCLLFSFTNPAHEKEVARRLRRRALPVSVSHEILPEFREFERAATTVVNAYLVPVMGRYLAELRARARRHARSRVRIMQSSGGIVSAARAAREPVRTILSGPAGGVLGARDVAARAGFDRIITFDMGGTSTDVALLEGDLRTTQESTVAELPVAVPMLDIHTVGAGGGSLARFDRAGALRVGPESAGADPGPLCYGRGDRPTVTDAHVVLGHLPPDGLLGGAFPLDAARARRGMERARGPIRTLERFAQGILDVANATMEKAIRVISVERGHDPRDYVLVAFGGAGPLHGCDLAAALGIPRVLVPRFPGALSALGILGADVVRDFSLTVRRRVQTRREARAALERDAARLEGPALAQMAAEGFAPGRVRLVRLLDLRYVGQAYELTVPFAGDFVGAFHRLHHRRYGECDARRPVEVVNVRLRARAATPKPDLPRAPRGVADPSAALVGTRHIFCGGRSLPARFYRRERLRPGNRLRGPAVVSEYSATTLVPPGWRARVDACAHLILERVRR